MAMTVAFTKRYVRDKVALFFTVVFPLIFLVIFGGIFGGDDGPNFDVAIIDNANTSFAADFQQQMSESELFTITEVEGFEDAEEQIGRGSLDAIVQFPEGFGDPDQLGRPSGELEIIYDQSDEQLASTLSGVLGSVIDGINSEFLTETPPLSLTVQPIQTADLSQFDYTLPGLIGFSILGLGIFSMSEGFTADKKTGSLKRMRVAPIQAWHVIVATALNRVFIGIGTVALMFLAGVVFFGFEMRGDYFSFALFSVLGTICMFGFGMAIAGWATDANQAAPISNIVAFPMMFLSGVFFPRFLMPDWLQGITEYIPLTPIIDGLRLILTEGQTLLDLGPQIAIIAAWSAFIYLVAFKTFRWE